MAIINGTIADNTLLGTAGNDTMTGGGGNDVARMRAGDDVFVWNDGDGSDTVSGGDGFDNVRFTFGAAGDLMHIDPNGTGARFFRNINGVPMSLISTNLSGVERINLRPLGDSDSITVNNLAGTGVRVVAIDLAGKLGGAVGDGANDFVTRYGSGGNDVINAALVGDKVSVTGLSTQITISHTDATDVLAIYGLEGNDTINAGQLAAEIMRVGLNGGLGNDRITGSQGNNDLSGDFGDDTIVGGRGVDSVFLGAGNDVFVWNAGDGGDFVHGQDDVDTLRFNGNAASETITIFTDAGGALVSRGAITVATDEVERLQVRALGGADSIVVKDLTGAPVTSVVIDLAATAGGTLADKWVDTVTGIGTVNNDAIGVSLSNGEVVASGLAAPLRVAHAGATDVLAINGDSGNDSISGAGLPTGKMSLRLLGGAGDDTLTGTGGNDTIRGGAGNDFALLGAGNDVFIWNLGDGADIVKGGTGIDTWVFPGTNASDSVSFQASGGQVESSFSFLDHVERIRVLAGDGADTIAVNDVGGTDLKQVLIDLGGSGVSGDGAQDVVDALGTGGNDNVAVSITGGVISVTGLSTQVTVSHATAIDVLNIYGDDGNDTIDASTLPASAAQLVLNGGSGNDLITGTVGNDTAHGDSGNDTLRGGGGADKLNGDDADDRLLGGDGNDSLAGSSGDDVLLGGQGDDQLLGGSGNDTITAGAGNDMVLYIDKLDGHDVILAFDGNPTGGQDRLNLDQLFDSLGVGPERATRISIVDHGDTVDIAVDTDGTGGVDLAVATLHTSDVITLGEDVIIF